METFKKEKPLFIPNNITSTIMEIDPELWQLWFDEMPYEFQRDITESHVNKIALAMGQGEFPAATSVEIDQLPDGREFLINGRHRALASIRSNTTHAFCVIRRSVLTEEDVQRDYQRMDIGKNRTFQDVLRPLQLAQELAMSERDIKYLAPAVSFLSNQLFLGNHQLFTNDDRIRWMRLYAPHMRQYRLLCENMPSEIGYRTLRQATVAAALLTIRYGNEKARDFWIRCIHNDSVPASDPCRFVNIHLMTSDITGGNSPTPRAGRKGTNSAASVRYIAACWNLFVAGETRKIIRSVGDTEPVKFTGVPMPSMWMLP